MNSYRVYISSTYKDLLDQREAAAKVVRELRHQTIAMEDYVSTETKPVEKCCADVRSAHIYIGIIAFRYGYIPDGYDKSITHLEYEAAGDAGIPRLLFLIDESAPWPVNMLDDDMRNIRQFRELLQKSHTSPPLKKINDLPAKIIAALSSEIRTIEAQNQPAHSPPGTSAPDQQIHTNLPYLCNRSVQRDAIEEALDEEVVDDLHGTPTHSRDLLHRAPFVGIIHGDMSECHEKFVTKLQEHILPELLGLPARTNTIVRKNVVWPSKSVSAKIRSKNLYKNIARALTGNMHTDQQHVVDALNRTRTPVIVYASIHTVGWQKSDGEVIESWLQYWHSLPDLYIDKKLFVLLCVRYQTLEGKTERRAQKYAEFNEQASRCIENLQFDNYPNLCGLVVPRLEAVELNDLERWIERYAAPFCDDEQLRLKIHQYFDKEDCDELPMATLAPILRKFMKEIDTENSL